MDVELIDLKKELKCWESMFSRKYGRKPAKDDIDQSSPEIRDSYRRYAHLKCKKSGDSAVKSSCTQVEDDGVFSASLNKKPKKPTSPEKAFSLKKVSCEWRPKLKALKRPGKLDHQDEENDENNVVEDKELMNFQISTSVEDMVTPPARRTFPSVRKKSLSSTRFKNVSQDLLNTCRDLLDKTDSTSLEKNVGETCDINNSIPICNNSEPPFSSGEHVTANSLRDSGVNNSDFPVLKEVSLTPNTFLTSESNENSAKEHVSRLNNENTISVKNNTISDSSEFYSISDAHRNSRVSDKKELESHLCTSNLDNTSKGNIHHINTSNFMSNGDSKVISPHKNKLKTDPIEIINTTHKEVSCSSKKTMAPEIAKRSMPSVNSVEVKVSSEVFNFNVESESNIVSEKDSLPTVKQRPKRGRKKKVLEVNDPSEDESSGSNAIITSKRKRMSDSEISTPPDKGTKRRKKVPLKTDSQLLGDGEKENAVDDKKARKPAKDDAGKIGATSKKVSVSKKSAAKTRLVSENFVKIDLKKKTYVRGLKKMTGAQYKRKQFRQKTSFQLPNKNVSKTGKSICFKCGGEGHWAKFCKGPKKKVDPFSKLDEEKNSIEFEHGGEENKSCFNYLEFGDKKPVNNGTGNFTVDDVMDIDPVWPRVPYQTTSDQQPDVLPLYDADDGKPFSDTYNKVSASLQTFGFDSFREGQHEAITRIVSGLSTLVILSTGSGKSLCYQLPAYMYYKERKWITIVVSPLIALMQDQVDGLPSFLPGACLNSNMTKLQKERVVKKLKDGNLAVLLVSPETLVSGGFGYGLLPPKSTLPPIAFACVDEAHCLSEWSHNFRPSYLKVCKVLQDRYNIKCLLGLTATASLATAKSVVHHLGITSEGSIIRDPHPIPENLQITASRDANKDEALVQLFQIPPFEGCDSIIVYATRRTEVERLAGKLRACLPDYAPAEKDEEEKEREKQKQKKKTKVRARKTPKPFWWNVECYHAGLTPAQRKRVQNEFMSGELRIVVATVAFGMGLDKSDVRSVIHYNLPKSFENYVQEIGRAGRDGKPSFCHVFISEESDDLNEIRRHIYGNSIDRRTVEKFVDVAFPSCRCLELNKKNTSKEEKKEEGNEQKNREILDSFEFVNNVSNFEDTRQSLSDDEMEMLFSQQFDGDILDDCQSVEGMDITSEKYAENVVSCTEINKSNSNNAESICENAPITEDNLLHITSNQVVEIECMEIKIETVKCNDLDTDNPIDFDINCSSSKDRNNVNYCSGHRVCFTVDDAIADLDMPEENIATLMSYLELHPKRWLEVLNPLRASCSLKCYGGAEQFQLVAKKFHPIALAVRYLITADSQRLNDRRGIDFNFGEVADLMCWDVLTVAREVRSLQWNMDFALDGPLNSTGKSGIIVECENVSFHVVTGEGIDDNEKDEISDFLHESVLKQEETRLLQLDALYHILRELSCENYWQVKSGIRVDANVRKCIVNYFMSDGEGQLDILREMCLSKKEETVPERRWNAIANDISTILISHPEQSFTGRAIARIFHGIGSPCYPAIVYGRDRRFWRVYLDVDFNELRIFASKFINRFKGASIK